MSHTIASTPGAREAWHQGRRWYEVWVLDVTDHAVVERRDAVARALGPLVVPFSVGTPHITVWVPGFRPVGGHVAEGREVEVTVGGANAFGSCPFLEVRCPALTGLRGGFLQPEDAAPHYLPHVTVGRFSGRHRVAGVAGTLRPYRSLPVLRVAATFRPSWLDAWAEDGRLSYTRPASSDTT